MYMALPDEENVICVLLLKDIYVYSIKLYIQLNKLNGASMPFSIQDQNKIRKNCKISTQLQSVNMAYSLDGYLWAVSSLATEKLQIWCVMTDQYVEIKPPLQILDIGNGCKAFSSTIYIPAKSELTATLQSVTQSMFFLNYNTKYSNILQYLIWLKISFSQLTPEETNKLKNKLQLLPSMPMEEFEKELEQIDTNYPLSMPIGLQLSVQIIVGLAFLAAILIRIWLYCKHKSHVKGLWNLTSKVPDML